MNHPLRIPLIAVAVAILLAVVVGAVMFRYEVRASGGVSYDRWTGDVQVNTTGEWVSLSDM